MRIAVSTVDTSLSSKRAPVFMSRKW